MATIRSFERPFELTDYTQEILLVPNTWGLINEMGVFRNEGVAQNTITVESREGTLGLLVDKVRGERNTVNQDDTRIIRSFAIPHFVQDDSVKPEDISGKRAYGSADAAETEAAVMARKLERIRRNHAITLEAARAQAIVSGTTYAPSGTVSANYFSDFNVTRKSVDFVLGTTTTDVLAKGEEVVAHIQDNIQSGEVVTGVTVLCSPAFFAKLISQAGVKEAYKYYSSTQEPLRQRLGSGIYRRFEHGGITYIEYRASYNGTALIPAGEAYAVPMGTTDTFVTYFGPANRFSHVNTIGEEAYAFTYRNPTDTEIQIQTESNHLSLVRRPQVLVKLTTST
jgi:hypothetical protein